MTNRELYFILKRGKVFSKFCLTCAHAFYLDKLPRKELEEYVDGTAKKLIEKDEENFIESIKMWNIIKQVKII